MNKTDMQLKQDIEAELRWDPSVNAAQIGVTVGNGAVSLLGTVDTHAEKWAAEDAVKRVGGVRSLAQQLTVAVRGDHRHTDTEIAGAALHALKWDVMVPKDVTARVEDGFITLEGDARWQFQRDAAERAVGYLTGVTGVSNAIRLMSTAKVAQVKEKVEAALVRQATTDAKSIKVDATDGKVTLTGSASSWHAIEDAANAAWAAPGVTAVIDQIHMNGY
jgi:osmotically-inducible protein OsmY